MSIEALKEQARRHEQTEDWLKALDQYKKAIAQLEADDQPDIGLYNRVGDLFVRVGKLDQAVSHYNRSADLYVEAELLNNAIAVCKKIIRNVPQRHEAYLRIGQIRAMQGFLPDARTNFLTYAERMQQTGNLDESFRALVEFCDLAPDEVDMRQLVAEQMASQSRVTDAVEQLSVAYRTLTLKGDHRAGEFEARIRELDPSADLSVAAAASVEAPAFGHGSPVSRGAEIEATFGEIVIGGGAQEEPAKAGLETSSSDVDATAEDVGAVVPEADEKAAALDLPVFDFGDDAEEAAPLPVFDFDDDEEEAAPLPVFDFDDDEEEATPSIPSAEAMEAAVEEAAADALAPEETPDKVRARIGQSPDDLDLRQRLVEMAYQTGDESILVEAFFGLGETLSRAGFASRAKAAFEQVLHLDPGHEGARAALGSAAPASKPVREVAAHEDYVDLGALLLGDDAEKTTRFVVAYEEPSGDEAADFAKMLSQFKEKVSQNLDADDVKAHQDLGTAYKEMGLLDEAVAEFQQALRASSDHLPTFELLGQTFLEMGKPDAAVRSLTRALDVPCDIEDELIAIYYYLARAYEQLGNKESAMEFYDRVFSLDINFADVTERLRALR